MNGDNCPRAFKCRNRGKDGICYDDVFNGGIYCFNSKYGYFGGVKKSIRSDENEDFREDICVSFGNYVRSAHSGEHRK